MVSVNLQDGPWGKEEGSFQRKASPQKNPFENVEDFFKKRRGSGGFSGGKGPFKPGRILGVLLGIAVVLWILSGLYVVQEGQQGAVLRFGAWVKTTTPGIQYHLPFPIESVEVRRTDEIRRIDSGVPVKSMVALRAENSDNLMLTGDENIVFLEFTVHWFIKDLGAYLFRIDQPDKAVRLSSESAMREIIGQNTLSFALTSGRGEISLKAKNLAQKMLDDYNAGVEIQHIQLKRVDPPAQVIDAFRDVQRAVADKESKINEAKSYANAVIPQARGEANKILQASQAYKRAIVDKASGKAQRFSLVREQYKMAPEVTRKRLILEATEAVFKNTPKMIIEPKSNSTGVLPFLPLKSLTPETQKPKS